MNSIPSLLALFFPLIAAAAVADRTTTTLATRNDPHSPCGVALYIGVASTRYTRNEICHVTGSTQPGGHGEVDLFTDKECDRQHFFYNTTAPPPFGAKREYHNGDSIKDKNPVDDFTITQASGECQADGGNCYPVLRYEIVASRFSPFLFPLLPPLPDIIKLSSPPTFFHCNNNNN